MVVEAIAAAADLQLPVHTLAADLKHAAAVPDPRLAQRIPAADSLIPPQLAPSRHEPRRLAAMAASNAPKAASKRAVQPNVRAAVMPGVPAVAASTPAAAGMPAVAAVDTLAADTSNSRRAKAAQPAEPISSAVFTFRPDFKTLT
jgi:hypothetical protein